MVDRELDHVWEEIKLSRERFHDLAGRLYAIELRQRFIGSLGVKVLSLAGSVAALAISAYAATK